jgi:hypothetical protein
MEDWAHHILDVVENSIIAKATFISLIITVENNILKFSLSDNGIGMSSHFIAKVSDPFVTTRKTRNIGLGLSLLAQACRESGGDIEIKSVVGRGTVINATTNLCHLDCKPIGPLGDIWLCLVVGYPNIDFEINCEFSDNAFNIDTFDIKSRLGEVPISHPEVITVLNKIIKDQINEWVSLLPNFYKLKTTINNSFCSF